MGVVVFDSTIFKARYPEFNSVAVPSLQGCFDEATLYLSNADNATVQDLNRRRVLLNMLTAHIAKLGGLLSLDGQALPVGRISDASEGSVSVSFDYGTPGSEVWFIQTTYGASFWQATKSLRTMRYIPNPTRY